jgi:hypothetical protein
MRAVLITLAAATVALGASVGARAQSHIYPAYVSVCNSVKPEQDLWVAVIEPTLTYDGWRLAKPAGWFKVKPRACYNVFKTAGSNWTNVYIHVEGDKSGVWSSQPRSGTTKVGLAPTSAFWCVNKGEAKLWPDNRKHSPVSKPVCPAGSRLVSAGRVTVRPGMNGNYGDSFNLTIR